MSLIKIKQDRCLGTVVLFGIVTNSSVAAGLGLIKEEQFRSISRVLMIPCRCWRVL